MNIWREENVDRDDCSDGIRTTALALKPKNSGRPAKASKKGRVCGRQAAVELTCCSKGELRSVQMTRHFRKDEMILPNKALDHLSITPSKVRSLLHL